MKKSLLLLAVLMLACVSAGAQNFLEKMKDRAKNAVENNIGNKVERGINNLLDGKKAEKNTTDEVGSNHAAKDGASQDGGTWTCPECGTPSYREQNQGRPRWLPFPASSING